MPYLFCDLNKSSSYMTFEANLALCGPLSRKKQYLCIACSRLLSIQWRIRNKPHNVI